MCGLTEEEVLAITEHEHLPEVAATALAHYLLSHEHGSEKIRDMIVDDIREAQWSGNKEHVLTLLHVLHHFLITHPEARPPEHPWCLAPGGHFQASAAKRMGSPRRTICEVSQKTKNCSAHPCSVYS